MDNFLKNLKQKSTPSSLMTKSISMLLILILPFNILALFISNSSYRHAVENVKSMITYTMDSYMTILTDKLSNTDIMYYNLFHYNSDYITLTKQEDTWQYDFARYQVYNSVLNQMDISAIADHVFIYMKTSDDLLQVPSNQKPYGNTNISKEFYMNYIDQYSVKYANWFLTYDNDSPLLVRVLYDSSTNIYYGACVELKNTIHDLQNAVNFDTISFQFTTETIPATASTLSWSSPLEENVILNATISSSELGSNISIWQYGIFILFILYLFLVPVLIFLLRRSVVKPLKSLNLAHHKLKEGNVDYRISEKINSVEFDEAFHSFNEMASSLQILQREVFEKELANKQLQIDFLQLQIRPHFLLNSFNVLYTQIQNGQRQPAQDMVLYLSDYFRYLFRSGRELQLFSKEIKMIQNYLDICKIYYPQAFTVSYQIDPVISLMLVPPLLMHSFIENIIQHAIRPDRVVHIIFSGEYDEGLVTFYISDDGTGIDKEAIEAINHIDETPFDDGKNVGLKNSFRRLKYYYGEGASVTVESEINFGTTFTIMIPYNLEEVDDESFIS